MPNQIVEPRLWGVLELAQRFEVNPVTIRSYIRRGRLKATRKGRKYLISEEAIKELFRGDTTRDAQKPSSEDK